MLFSDSSVLVPVFLAQHPHRNLDADEYLACIREAAADRFAVGPTTTR